MRTIHRTSSTSTRSASASMGSVIKKKKMNLHSKSTTKEEIQKIEEIILAFQPILKEKVKFNYRKIVGEIYHLSITNENRECHFQRYNGIEFLADGSVIFSYYQEIEETANLIKYWLVDNLMPSQLIDKVPNLNIGKLSKYYEDGELIKGEFVLSWEDKESFYLSERGHMNFNESKKNEIKTFFQNLIDKNYNEKTRAGLSIRSLVLTRARRHGGIGSNTPFVSFFFFEDKSGMLVTERDGNLKEFEMPVIFNLRIEQMLNKLITNEIK